MAEKKINKDFWVGVGRRKSAIASVKLSQTDKNYMINGKKSEISIDLENPLILVGMKEKFGIMAKVSGGGKVSQVDAIKLGIARALEKFNPEFRGTLKKAGLLTRDPREKERKKPGLKGARRAPQWAKR
ncbi:MAG: 30S ribosomal protein S9 [bacterium]|nr:30S ribosomal protein S9 [bacterium]